MDSGAAPTHPNPKGVVKLWRKARKFLTQRPRTLSSADPRASPLSEPGTDARPPSSKLTTEQTSPSPLPYSNSGGAGQSLPTGNSAASSNIATISPTDPIMASKISGMIPAAHQLSESPIEANKGATSKPKIEIQEAIVADTGNVSAREEALQRFERAQALFRKHDIELVESEWTFYNHVQGERVHKQVRMRVRFTCHLCKAMFGHTRVCSGCTHERCRKCPRDPPRKRKHKTERVGEYSERQPASAPATQAVGACHECQTRFNEGALECENCHHTICERCLQEIISVVDEADDPHTSTTGATIPATSTSTTTTTMYQPTPTTPNRAGAQ